MLHRLGWLDDTELSIEDLARVTSGVVSDYQHKHLDNLYMLHASKIWSVIISRPCSTFIINTTQRCECAGCVFSIYISSKLKKDFEGSGRFEMTKHTKQMLYIIHLTLDAEIYKHPVFSNEIVYKELHTSIQEFFEKDLFENHTTENQFLLLQLYLKCKITIKGTFSPHDEQVFYLLFDSFATYPSLKLNSVYLFSHVLYQLSVQWNSEELNMPSNLEKIKLFTRELILALSNDFYVNKLQSEQKLLLYEDIKKNHISMITDDHVTYVFIRCKCHLRNQFKYESFEVFGNEEYTLYKKVLAKVVISFYESIFLDIITVEDYLNMLENYSSHLSNIPSYQNIYGNMPGPSSHAQTIHLGRLSIPGILRWFMLMFELKFLFGDINSQFTELYFK
ncbi:hypothetical protein RF11_05243 [Thelohanellus kitauei]|uniref:Uncharacterized protein n=1 Tax=Thelohanellus kitauei TaxID=669202 RepID=A0A0C2JPN8_THEKT|nr:hypothetical protein RF11_05243 [Thelohanellus kitauei]